MSVVREGEEVARLIYISPGFIIEWPAQCGNTVMKRAEWLLGLEDLLAFSCLSCNLYRLLLTVTKETPDMTDIEVSPFR